MGANKLETAMIFGIVYLLAMSILGLSAVLIDEKGQAKEPWAYVSPTGRSFMVIFLTLLAIGNLLSLALLIWWVLSNENHGAYFVAFVFLELLTNFLLFRSSASLFRSSSLGGIPFLVCLGATTLTYFLGLYFLFGSSPESAYPLSRTLSFFVAGIVAVFAHGEIHDGANHYKASTD